MGFRLLGPLEVTDAGGRVVDAGRPGQRALLALLLLNANRVVPLRIICDGLWGEEPPASAANSVQVYVSRLRKVLGTDVPLTTVARGYRLEVPAEAIDVARFERLAADGGAALERGDLAAAVPALREALDLRRGPPLAEFAGIPFAAAECARLSQLIRLAEENYAEARLAVGQHGELVGELEGLVELDPFSERCWGLLMTALYRCGRQADALAAFRRARQILVEQLGIEPGPELRRIEAGVLAQSLAPAPAPVTSIGRVNLPSRAASFVGRDLEVAELEKVMATARLVMLTGPGGCGKTSLAIALAEAMAGSYADGLWFVDLAPLSSPDQVPAAVCDAFGVRQLPGQTLIQTAAEYAGHQKALVVLDNCEHVLEASRAVVEATLRAGPTVKVLATSREHFGIPGEVIWQVPPLTGSDAVRLFAERAESALPSFRLGAHSQSVINGVCCRLDGIPLAIELAAARVSALSPRQIAARLDDALRFLGRQPPGAISRQRTLRATLDWSYDLLSVPEQKLLARLAVFAGGFTLSAVEAVGPCAELPAEDVVDLFARLADKSLVTRAGASERNREPRYRLLDTIRQYAWARLAEQGDDEAGKVRSAHSAYFLALAEEIEPNLYLAGSRPWFDRADAENDNFRAALEWAFAGGELDGEIGPRLVAALAWGWFIDGRLAEGRAWADQALAVTDGQRTFVRGRALLAGTALASGQSDLDHMAQLADEAAELGDELGSSYLRAAGLNWLGLARWAQGHLDDAIALLEEAAGLHGSHGNRWYDAVCLAELGRALADCGRLGEARHMLDLGVRRARRLGEDAALGFTLDARALFALKCGELDTAAEIIGEAINHYRASGYLEGQASGLNTQALAALARDDSASAAASFAEALTLCRRLGHLGGAATALAGLARVADKAGDAARAAQLCAAAATLRARAGAIMTASEQASLGELTSRLAAELGPAAFGDAWAAGQAIRLDQAQELAGQHLSR
jgi:predicted ATPase/DNA-binding SARP family transcriptional activator